MVRVGIALGSNLGDRLNNLRSACEQLRKLAVSDEPFVCSLIYQTEPKFCPPGSPDFLNAVVDFSYRGSARELLDAARAIESLLGRVRGAERNAPRVIDLDLLYVGDEVCDSEELELPHPRIAERRFVLQPLVDVAAGLVLPGEVVTVAEQLAMLAPDEAPLVAIEDGLEG